MGVVEDGLLVVFFVVGVVLFWIFVVLLLLFELCVFGDLWLCWIFVEVGIVLVLSFDVLLGEFFDIEIVNEVVGLLLLWGIGSVGKKLGVGDVGE